jgi:hypothetical protein
MSKNTLVDLLLTKVSTVSTTPKKQLTPAKITGAIKTAFESAVAEPEVTRGELEDVLKQNAREHTEMQAEISELQRTQGLVGDVDQVIGLVGNLSNVVDADMTMSNVALESIGRRFKSTAPKFTTVHGRVTTASMEGAKEWLDKLKDGAKATVQKTIQAFTLSGLRSDKTIALYRQRIAYIRKMSKDKAAVVGPTVKLHRSNSMALEMGKGYSTDLVGDLKRFFIFSDTVANRSGQEYIKSLDAIAGLIPTLDSASNNTEFETILKQCASKAIDFSFFKEIENGSKPYLGNLLYTAPKFVGKVSDKLWMHPIMKMMECPGYEVESDRTAINIPIPTLTHTQCEAVLNEIEIGLELLEKSNDTWKKTVEGCSAAYWTGVNYLGISAVTWRNWGCPLDDENSKNVFMVVNNGVYISAPLYTTAAMINVPLSNSVYAALLLVELSLLG